MAELYSRMLKNGMTENIKVEMMFSLANYERASGRLATAKEIWETLYASPFHHFTNRTRMQLADVAFDERRFKDCLELCEIISSEAGRQQVGIRSSFGHPETDGWPSLRTECEAENGAPLRQSHCVYAVGQIPATRVETGGSNV